MLYISNYFRALFFQCFKYYDVQKYKCHRIEEIPCLVLKWKIAHLDDKYDFVIINSNQVIALVKKKKIAKPNSQIMNTVTVFIMLHDHRCMPF